METRKLIIIVVVIFISGFVNEARSVGIIIFMIFYTHLAIEKVVSLQLFRIGF